MKDLPRPSPANKWIIEVLPFLVGLTFLCSGIAKLADIQEFELYVYSFGWMPFAWAEIASRGLVALEMILGLMFLTRLSLRHVAWASLSMLTALSLLLVWMLVVGRKDDCHCFGEWIRLSAGASLAKNFLLAVLAVLTLKHPVTGWPWTQRLRRPLTVALGLLCITASLAIQPPGFLYLRDTTETRYCRPCAEEFLKENRLDRGRHLVAFLSPSCRYCRMTAKRLTVMTGQGLPSKAVRIVFWSMPQGRSTFYAESGSANFPFLVEETLSFLRLTDGAMPLVLLVEDGAIRQALHYEDLDEAVVRRFFQSESR